MFVVLDSSMLSTRTMLPSVACLTPPHFSTLSHKKVLLGGGGVIEHKMCVLILSTAFVLNISHSKKNLFGEIS
jgi:hypothetical protein